MRAAASPPRSAPALRAARRARVRHRCSAGAPRRREDEHEFALLALAARVSQPAPRERQARTSSNFLLRSAPAPLRSGPSRSACQTSASGCGGGLVQRPAGRSRARAPCALAWLGGPGPAKRKRLAAKAGRDIAAATASPGAGSADAGGVRLATRWPGSASAGRPASLTSATFLLRVAPHKYLCRARSCGSCSATVRAEMP